MGYEHGASDRDGPVVAVVCGSRGQFGQGVPLHSEHDVVGIGNASHGPQKSDGQGCGRRGRAGHGGRFGAEGQRDCVFHRVRRRRDIRSHGGFHAGLYGAG